MLNNIYLKASIKYIVILALLVPAVSFGAEAVIKRQPDRIDTMLTEDYDNDESVDNIEDVDYKKTSIDVKTTDNAEINNIRDKVQKVRDLLIESEILENSEKKDSEPNTSIIKASSSIIKQEIKIKNEYYTHDITLVRCNNNDQECAKVYKYIEQKDHVNQVDVFRIYPYPSFYFATSSVRSSLNGPSYILLEIRNNKIYELFDKIMSGASYEFDLRTEYPKIKITSKHNGQDIDEHFIEYKKGKYEISKYIYKKYLLAGKLYDMLSEKNNIKLNSIAWYSFSGEVDANRVPKSNNGYLDGKILSVCKDESGSVYIVYDNRVAYKALGKSVLEGYPFVQYIKQRIIYSNNYKKSISKHKNKTLVTAYDHEQYFLRNKSSSKSGMRGMRVSPKIFEHPNFRFEER